MHMNPVDRELLAARVLAQLKAAIPGSIALLRGSLSEGHADPYSDIDVLWEVPDASFGEAVNRASALLTTVQPVESVRMDPDFQRSARRRLFFVRFADVPLFWRLDLDVFAASINRDFTYDADNPHARGSEWSRTESALANGVAAVKAYLRGDETAAQDLVSRAFERVAVPRPDGRLPDRLMALVGTVTAIDPTTSGFAGRVRQLIHEQLIRNH